MDRFERAVGFDQADAVREAVFGKQSVALPRGQFGHPLARGSPAEVDGPPAPSEVGAKDARMLAGHELRRGGGLSPDFGRCGGDQPGIGDGQIERDQQQSCQLPLGFLQRLLPGFAKQPKEGDAHHGGLQECPLHVGTTSTPVEGPERCIGVLPQKAGQSILPGRIFGSRSQHRCDPGCHSPGGDEQEHTCPAESLEYLNEPFSLLLKQSIPADGGELTEGECGDDEQLGGVTEIDVRREQGRHQPIDSADLRAEGKLLGIHSQHDGAELPRYPAEPIPPQAPKRENEDEPRQPAGSFVRAAQSELCDRKQNGKQSHVKSWRPDAAFRRPQTEPAALGGKHAPADVRPDQFGISPWADAEVIGPLMVRGGIGMAEQSLSDFSGWKIDAGGCLINAPRPAVCGPLTFLRCFRGRKNLHGRQQKADQGCQTEQENVMQERVTDQTLPKSGGGRLVLRLGFAQGQHDRIQPRHQQRMISRLRLTAEDHQCEYRTQPDGISPTPAAKHLVRRQCRKRQPGSTEEEHDIAILKDDVASTGIGQCRSACRHVTRLPVTRQQVRTDCGQNDMANHIELVIEVEVQRQCKEELTGIEHAAAGVGHNRNAAVLIGIPQRNSAVTPLTGRPLKQRMIEMSRVPHGKGAVGKKHRAEQRGQRQKEEKANDEIRMTNDEWRILRCIHSSFGIRISELVSSSRCQLQVFAVKLFRELLQVGPHSLERRGDATSIFPAGRGTGVRNAFAADQSRQPPFQRQPLLTFRVIYAVVGSAAIQGGRFKFDNANHATIHRNQSGERMI